MRASRISLIIVGLIAVISYFTLFTVLEVKNAIVLQFGDPKRVITEPGLNFKMPFIQNVIFIDTRILDIDAPAAAGASISSILVSINITFCINGILKFKPGSVITLLGSPNCRTIAFFTSNTVNKVKYEITAIKPTIISEILDALIN